MAMQDDIDKVRVYDWEREEVGFDFILTKKDYFVNEE